MYEQIQCYAQFETTALISRDCIHSLFVSFEASANFIFKYLLSKIIQTFNRDGSLTLRRARVTEMHVAKEKIFVAALQPLGILPWVQQSKKCSKFQLCFACQDVGVNVLFKVRSYAIL